MSLIFKSLFLFFIYSFIGWFIETIIFVIKNKSLSNRGFLNGPLCISYGFATILITLFFYKIDNYLFFFIGCVFICLIIEYLSGYILSKITKRKWWDLSKTKFNFGEYASYIHALLFGLLSLSVNKLNILFINLYNLIPNILNIVIILLLIIFLIDLLASIITILNISKLDKIVKLNKNTSKFTLKLENSIKNRITKAYPMFKNKKSTDVLSFNKIFLLFMIGAFLGDVIETIFCRIHMGEWISRSSVVYGPFSIVWGLAIVLATLLLYKYKDKSDSFIFFYGTILGGIYEYICSIFTEIVFHTVFWDYSNIPFNIAGRINLLYCFFWGIAAVIWIKIIYPFISRLIDKIPKNINNFIVIILFIFMIFNISVTILALNRFDKRNNGITPNSKVEEYLDIKYDDEKMKKIYPYAVKTD